MENVQSLIHSYKEEMIKSLQTCIQIKSISDDPEGTKKVLSFFLDLAAGMGFTVLNIDDLGGVIEHGEGKKVIGMIGHLDTVPEGSGWKFPPFEGKIQDGKIYGRGAIDDKGPSIAALYALKAIKESGIKPPSKIMMILGIDEETIWHSTPKLLEKIQQPDFSFVPDAKFPLVIAEKGLFWLEVRKKLSKEHSSALWIQQLQGGSPALNMVPEACHATLCAATPQELTKVEESLQTFLQQNPTLQVTATRNGQEIELLAQGKPSHAFQPQEGLNAISVLIAFLSQLSLPQDQKQFLLTYMQKIGMESDGTSLSLATADQRTGPLTVSPGWIKMDCSQVTLQIDLRFPASKKRQEMQPKVQAAFRGFDGNTRFLDSLESLSFPEEDPHIQTLLKIYRDYTGDPSAKPLGMGGTTYAKAFQNAVSFGPTFPGMPKVEHQADEYIEVDHLLKCAEIYALALAALTGESATE